MVAGRQVHAGKYTLNAQSLTRSATRVGSLSRNAGEALSRGCRGGLARLGPAFGKGEGAGAEGTPLPFQRPGLAFGFDAVAREARAERRDQQGADAIFAAALARVRVNEQRLADLVPGQRDVLARGVDALGPEIARVALLAEGRVNNG